MTNRVKLARENAGLSIDQAAKLLGILSLDLERIESPERRFVERAEDLADLYGVSVDWLTGHAPLRDYATIDAMRNADKLSVLDRDTLAEFAASLPRKPKP